MDDPRLARRLARFSWVVLVTALVVVGRLDLPPSPEHAVIAALIAVMAALNAPTALGLWRSRAHARTGAFTLVAVSLVVRVIATCGIAWLI